MAKPEIVRPWYHASSNDGSSCVETQFYADGSVDVRNSKNPGAGFVSFDADEWTAFIKGANEGKFNPVA